MHRLRAHLRAHLTSGLLLTIPLAITYAVLAFVWDAIQGLMEPLVDRVPGPISGLALDVAILLALVVLIYIAGLVGRTLVGGRLFRVWESIIDRIPIVRPIYRIARQSTQVFAGGIDLRSSKVVLLEYPRPGVLSMGLVTSHYISEDDQLLLTIYIPTIPNPTSGFLAIVQKDQVIETELTFEDAMKIVVSAGVLTGEVIKAHGGPPGAPTPPQSTGDGRSHPSSNSS